MASKRDDCIKKIADLGGISEAAAEKILDDVDGLAQAKRMAGEADPTLAAAYELAGKFKQAAKDARLDAVRNAAKRSELMDRVEAEGGLPAAANVLRSTLHWMPGAKRLDGVEGLWHGLSKQWLAVVGNKLRQEGLWDVAVSGQIDREVSQAMWDANQKGAIPTGNSPAEKIAAAFMPALQLAVKRMNGAGAHIGTALDYVMHTNWDSRALRLAGGKGADMDAAFAAWWAKDGPRMAEKTFEHIIPKDGETIEEAKMRFARSVYDATVTGIHLGRPGISAFDDDGAGFIPPAYEGTRNIAKGVSQQRMIFWKDADSWHDHMKEFGGGRTLTEQMSSSLSSGARSVALMERLGTNPAGNFNTVVRRVQEKYRSTDPDGLKPFQKKVGGLDNVLARLDGTANRPHNEDWARYFEYVQTAEAMAHLGGVSITHIAAAPGTVTSEMAMHGISRLSSLGDTLKAIVTGRGTVEGQQALAEAGAYATGYSLDMHTRWAPGSGVPGAMSWLSANFMKLTGLEHFLGQFQGRGIKGVLMHSLGQDAAAPLADMNQWRQALLRRYGIGDEEWDALRSAEPFHVDGQRYVTPKAAELATEDSIKAILKRKGIWNGQEGLPEMEQASLRRAIEKERWQLGDKILMYLNDAAEHGTVTPGVRERALIYRNTKPGDPLWMITRGLSQFKMWPLAAMNQIIGREIGYTFALKGKNAGAYASIGKGLGALLALSTLGGAVRMAVNDAASGKPQRNYLEPNTLLAALAQGGGLGVFGDFVFGETNRMGAGIVSTAAGPIIADADRLLTMYHRWKDDVLHKTGKAWNHLWPDAARFGIGHIPYANLIYLKGALDYMLWYHVYEAGSPGWFDRTNRRLQKETGRTMVGYVPGGGVPYGVPGLYLKNQVGQTSGLLGNGSLPGPRSP